MEDLFVFILPLLGAGAVAGFLAGLLGIGGGVVTIPALFIALEGLGVPIEWRMHTAIATSLVIIIATNSSSVYAHHKKQGVDWEIVKNWWFVILVGAVAGSFFAKTLKTEELVYIFATLAALLALKMLLPFDKFKAGDALPSGLFRYVNPGLIGFFSAVMGIGGGSFSVPYMTLYSVPIHRAVGTASLIGLVISVSAGAGYLIGGLSIDGLPSTNIGFVNWPSALIVAVASVFFAPLGAKAAHKMPKKALSIAFGTFLVIATYRLITSV
ncbi:sulfite exporter TauE/SafE family protein [Kordiimonas sp. SCSIO 12610]|uniref:sulfite exporter TauE/SafE family protein n=1 Tax=Kordiimonas sp. SCSIO 12610 TaxID=2829597 RepID=UPI00210BD776|nr:sulfite exporter TauE/SafE family protein [Kordiimonas sp. SCSIO 12610]UTW54105.1 sulfite exporter TauE/SafE family protein [Kordiimonas sp. SCSIO 12610]